MNKWFGCAIQIVAVIALLLCGFKAFQDSQGILSGFKGQNWSQMTFWAVLLIAGLLMEKKND